MGEASCPKATIVVPVYNSARSIQRCLDSLLAQSERSIQVVCVNDGSTDDSLNVLRQIAQADDRVLVVDQENAGVSCARNAGICLYGKCGSLCNGRCFPVGQPWCC